MEDHYLYTLQIASQFLVTLSYTISCRELHPACLSSTVALFSPDLRAFSISIAAT